MSNVGPRINRVLDAALETRRGQGWAAVALFGVSILVFVVVSWLAAARVGEAGLVLQFGMALVSVPFFGALVFALAAGGSGFPGGLRQGVVVYIVVGALALFFGVPGSVGGGMPHTGPFWPFFVLAGASHVLGLGPW